MLIIHTFKNFCLISFLLGVTKTFVNPIYRVVCKSDKLSTCIIFLYVDLKLSGGHPFV